MVLSAVLEIDCVNALKALGEETRLRILRLLSTEEFNVNDISAELNVTEYNISKHLRILREAGLVEARKAGKERRYAVTRALHKHLTRNNNVLDLGCCTFRFDKLPR